MRAAAERLTEAEAALQAATGSPARVEYAARHSDLVFITSPAGHEIDAALDALLAHNAMIKAAGAKRGRELRTIINPMIAFRVATHSGISGSRPHADPGKHREKHHDEHDPVSSSSPTKQAAATARSAAAPTPHAYRSSSACNPLYCGPEGMSQGHYARRGQQQQTSRDNHVFRSFRHDL